MLIKRKYKKNKRCKDEFIKGDGFEISTMEDRNLYFNARENRGYDERVRSAAMAIRKGKKTYFVKLEQEDLEHLKSAIDNILK